MHIKNKIIKINNSQEGLRRIARRRNCADNNDLIEKNDKLEEEKEILLKQLEEIKDLTQMGYNETFFKKKFSEKFPGAEIETALETREYYIQRYV